jgi:SpoVK/Ycf46/Vps4 family AAA+-type ATPase
MQQDVLSEDYRHKNILIFFLPVYLALTNRPHAIDTSLIRSGRLDKIFDLHLKGVNQRRQVLDILTKGMLPYHTGFAVQGDEFVYIH